MSQLFMPSPNKKTARCLYVSWCHCKKSCAQRRSYVQFQYFAFLKSASRSKREHKSWVLITTQMVLSDFRWFPPCCSGSTTWYAKMNTSAFCAQMKSPKSKQKDMLSPILYIFSGIRGYIIFISSPAAWRDAEGGDRCQRPIWYPWQRKKHQCGRRHFFVYPKTPSWTGSANLNLIFDQFHLNQISNVCWKHMQLDHHLPRRKTTQVAFIGSRRVVIIENIMGCKSHKRFERIPDEIAYKDPSCWWERTRSFFSTAAQLRRVFLKVDELLIANECKWT